MNPIEIDPTLAAPAQWEGDPNAYSNLAKELADHARKTHPRIVFLGDSITQGWGGEGKAKWDAHFAPLQAVNMGIGGDRTQNILWRIDQGALDGVTPELIVLKIGVNNLWEEVLHCGPEKVADGVAAIVKSICEKCPEAKVLVLGILPTHADPNDRLRSSVRDVNARTSRLVPTSDGRVRYVDIGGAFVEPDGSISTDIMPDGCHLSPEGYARFANALEPLIEEILKK